MRKANEGGAPLNGGDETVGGKNLDQLIAAYIDRINTGEKLDPVEVLAENPEWGEEIVEGLERYISLGDQSSDTPLGTLGDYTLRRQIGRGGMGVVYEAWQNSMDRQVALKVLPVGLAADEKTFTRFMREAKTAGKLDHPNVVAVHAAGFDENTPYYAMELVDGETLAQILVKIKDAEPETETPFGKKDDIRYFGELAAAFADVADGLQHAHSKGVVHRDIKPSNLILDHDGRLRILDFGLAHFEGQESLTLSGDFIGTPQYMSPEQALRRKIAVDHRTDVYSLGATLYEILTLQPPFRGKDHADTLSQIIERDPRPPRQLNSRVPTDLETIVLKCLRKGAGDRYGTAEALAQDLRRFVRGDPIEARPEANWEKAIRWTRRQAWRLAAAGVVSVLVVVVICLTWMVHEANRPRYDELVTREIHAILRQRLAGSSPLGTDEGPFVPPMLADTYGIKDAVENLGRYSDEFPERPEAPFWQAQGYLLLDDAQAAIAALNRALLADADFAPARVLRARLEVGAEDAAESAGSVEWAMVWSEADAARTSKDWQRALAAYDKLIRLRKWGQAELKLGMAVEVYLDRGVALTELGRYDEAIASLEAAAALVPEFLEPDLLTAKVYCLRGETERADALLEETYERGNKSDVVLRSILVVCDALEDYEKGLVWAKKLAPGATQELLLCSFYKHTERLEEAIDAGRRAVDLDPEEPASYHGLAWSLGKKIRGLPRGEERAELIEQRRGVAAKLLELAKRPGGETFLASAYNIHAKVLFHDGEVEEAIAACDRAIAIDERKTAMKSGILWVSGRFAEAEGLCRNALARLTHDNAERRGNLGLILGRLGKREDAIKELELSCDMQPGQSSPLRAFVWSLLATRHYERALKELGHLIELRPDKTGKLQAELFRAFWKAPELVEQSVAARAVLATLEAALKKEPALDAGGLTLLAFLRLHVGGGRDITAGDLAASLRDASEAVERTKRNDAEALAVLAECEYASGDAARAISTLMEGLELPEATLRHVGLLATYREQLPGTRLEGASAIAGAGATEDGAASAASDPLEALPSSWRETGVLRINCGGETYRDGNGHRWEKDNFFLGGRPDSRSPDLPTVDPLYDRQRSFPEETYRPVYRIPLPAGTYRVTLDFVEFFFGAAGLRSFDVIIEERELLEIGDLFARVGFGEVDSWTRSVRVEEGALDIRFIAGKDAPTIAAITIEPDR